MKKIVILLLLLLTSCKDTKVDDLNTTLMKIKNYSCSMKIESFSNKNVVILDANQTYKYPDNYKMEFDDSTLTTYTENTLSIENEKLNIAKSLNNYPNINKNPLFLSYFLNTYFNATTENIKKADESNVTINLPNNNPFLYKANLKLKNGIPTSMTYFDKNGNIKVNIIYNKFNIEPL